MHSRAHRSTQEPPSSGQEAPRSSQGAPRSNQSHQGDTQENPQKAPRRHPGDTQERPRGHPEAPRAQEAILSENVPKPLCFTIKSGATDRFV